MLTFLGPSPFAHVEKRTHTDMWSASHVHLGADFLGVVHLGCRKPEWVGAVAQSRGA